MQSYLDQLIDVKKYLDLRTLRVLQTKTNLTRKSFIVRIVPTEYAECHSEYFEILIRDDSFQNVFIEIRTNLDVSQKVAEIFCEYTIELSQSQKESSTSI